MDKKYVYILFAYAINSDNTLYGDHYIYGVFENLSGAIKCKKSLLEDYKNKYKVNNIEELKKFSPKIIRHKVSQLI